ncbi:MAG TPA: cytidylate kinase-like family protein [Acidobacteriaceae bacterium]|nr:cytidylate kinase-like family protein [Acidobacteriaceae bacterium]
MVKVITVEREYGSQGAEFAHRLAGRLGWRLIDHCLIEEIAQKAQVPKKMVESCDERLDPWYYRLGKSFWHGSVERLPAPPKDEVFDSERMVDLVRNYFKEAAGAGNCVILGRGAACALSTVPGVFNIFVYASMTRKIRWFEERFPEHAADARREIEATDARRASYIRRYYDQDWADRRLYHLMINSCMGCDAMISVALDGTGLSAQHSAASAVS